MSQVMDLGLLPQQAEGAHLHLVARLLPALLHQLPQAMVALVLRLLYPARQLLMRAAAAVAVEELGQLLGLEAREVVEMVETMIRQLIVPRVQQTPEAVEVVATLL